MLEKKLLNNPEDLMSAITDGHIDLQSIDDTELALISSILHEIDEKGDSPLLKQLYETDFWRTPPTIEEFLEDDFYMGSVCRKVEEDNQNGIYDIWRKSLTDAFQPGSVVNQMILTGCVDHQATVSLSNGEMPTLESLILRGGSQEIHTSDGASKSDKANHSGTMKVVSVLLRNGMSVRLTPDHLIECVAGDERLWKEAGSLTKDDFVVVPIPNITGVETLSDAAVKLLAYWPTNGNGGINPRYTGSLQTCNEVIQLLSDMGWSSKEPKPGHGDCWYVRPENPLKTGFSKWLIGHEAHHLCADVVVPPVIFSSSLRQIALFINRVWAAEGTSDGFLQLRMKPKKFILEIQHLLLRLGVFSSVNEIPIVSLGHSHWNLCINGTGSIKRFFEMVGLVFSKEESSGNLLDIANSKSHAHSSCEKTKQCYENIWPVKVEAVHHEDAPILVGDMINSSNKKWTANGISVHNSIGGGKSFCGSVAMLYKMARVVCMRNPLLYFGMSKIAKLTFTFLSADKAQIKEGAFSYAVNGMIASPFFTEQAKEVTDERKYSSMKIDLIQGVTLEAGSKARHALGRNVIGALVDEINFRIEKDAVKEAQTLITGLDRRYKSRFRHSTEGLIVVISSANNETDFLVKHVKKNRNNPSVMICDFPYWETAGPTKISYQYITNPKSKDAWFYVDIGSSIDPPKILDDPEDLEVIRSNYPTRLLKVPVEHRKEFEDDTSLAIKEIAGRSTGRMAKYFGNVRPLVKSIRDYESPCNSEEVRLSIDSDHGLEDFIKRKIFLKEADNRLRPARDPSLPRFIHMDMSMGAVDAMGFAMVHPTHFRMLERTDLASQRLAKMAMPVWELDLAFRIVREKSKEVLDFGKIRSFIVWLRSQGFKIAGVSCDLRTLSYETRNILKQLGFNSSYLSLDIKKDGYDTFRQVVQEDRFRCYRHDYLMVEAMNLEDTGKKIDHPAKFDIGFKLFEEEEEFMPTVGSKDITDAVAGAIMLGENARESFELPYENTALERLIASEEVRRGVTVKKQVINDDIRVF